MKRKSAGKKVAPAQNADMLRRGKIWTREETLAALNLYSSMPYGQIHDYEPRIAGLAKLLGRPSASVAMKMCNLASYDPKHRERGVKGLSRSCKMERLVWEEFEASPSEILYESEQLIAQFKGVKLKPEFPLEPESPTCPKGGKRKGLSRRA